MEAKGRFAEWFDVRLDRVINFRIEGGDAVGIINYGIEGCKKRRVSLDLIAAPVHLNATPAALRLIEEYAVDVAQFQGCDRVTVHDVRGVI